MRHAIIAVLLLAALAGTAVAGPFEDGVLAYQRGDYAEAARLFRRAAEPGQADVPVGPQGLATVVQDLQTRTKLEARTTKAQATLGFLYGEGLGVPQDYTEAVRWYRKAADQGEAYAQNKLGNRYRLGQGVPQDHVEAVTWYRLAAEQGHAGAQNNLGVMYDDGKGVLQDYAEAVKWYRLAAEQGYASSLFNLGAKYGLGQGVPQDYVLAHTWLNLATSRYPPGEGHDRSVLARDGVAERMTPAQIADAQKLAREWKPK